MPLEEKLAQLAESLSAFEDPQERLAFVVERARRIPPLPAAERTAAHRVPGCVSVVWIIGECEGGHCRFRFDADSPIVRGLLALLCEFYSGAAPAEILAHDIDPLEHLDLLRALSPTRRNGLASARAAIRAFARTCA